MDFDRFFNDKLDALRDEGNYRVFIDLQRRCGAFPNAQQTDGAKERPVTVWCSND